MKMNTLKTLISVANSLDSKGFVKESDRLDKIINKFSADFFDSVGDVKIYKDTDWDQFVVVPSGATEEQHYYTDDEQDARDTAKRMAEGESVAQKPTDWPDERQLNTDEGVEVEQRFLLSMHDNSPWIVLKESSLDELFREDVISGSAPSWRAIDIYNLRKEHRDYDYPETEAMGSNPLSYGFKRTKAVAILAQNEWQLSLKQLLDVHPDLNSDFTYENLKSLWDELGGWDYSVYDHSESGWLGPHKGPEIDYELREKLEGYTEELDQSDLSKRTTEDFPPDIYSEEGQTVEQEIPVGVEIEEFSDEPEEYYD